MIPSGSRLRKHADYQRVYKASRKQFSKQLSYFVAPRPSAGAMEGQCAGPRIGITVGKVIGKAVERNRIKRRIREAVRHHLGTLRTSVDVVIHPRGSVLEMPFSDLEREIASVFQVVQRRSSSTGGK